MQTYKVEFEKAALKFLGKQDKRQRERLYNAIQKLPMGSDIKKLKGFELYRMQIGNFRILYSVDEEIKIINIVNIDNRGDIYKRY